MEPELVSYADINLAPPTPEQYHENLLWQIDRGDLNPQTPTWDLERMIDTKTYIPLVNEDYRLAFCQATRNLPELCQSHIWTAVMRDDISFPKPKYELSPMMKAHMNRWKARKF